MGVCCPVLLTLVRPQNVIFYSRFQSSPLKSITVFRPGLQAEIMSSLLRSGIRGQTKKPHFEFAYFSVFLSYSFGSEKINTFIRSLENHTRFQIKMGKVFSDQKPYPLGRHGLYKGVPYRRERTFSGLFVQNFVKLGFSI